MPTGRAIDNSTIRPASSSKVEGTRAPAGTPTMADDERVEFVPPSADALGMCR